jgi:hypothetical protein
MHNINSTPQEYIQPLKETRPAEVKPQRMPEVEKELPLVTHQPSDSS